MEYDSSSNDIIIGSYSVDNLLKKAKNCNLYLGRHLPTNQSVLIKRIKTDFQSSNSDKDFHLREVNILKTLKHTNITKIYDIVKSHCHINIITEYNEGGSLAQFISNKGKLSEEEAKMFFIQLISAVSYLHNNKIVHLNITPYSLNLDRDKKTLILTDFYFSQYIQNDVELQSLICSSESYISPEMIHGEKYSGYFSDIWNCGIVLYNMVNGTSSFDYIENNYYENQSTLNSTLPNNNDLNELLRKMLLPEPYLRIDLSEIINHDWLKASKHINSKGDSEIDENILNYIQKEYCLGKELTRKYVLENELNCLTSLYYLTLKKKDENKTILIDCPNNNKIKVLNDIKKPDFNLKELYDKIRVILKEYYNNNFNILKQTNPCRNKNYNSLENLASIINSKKGKNQSTLGEENNKQMLENYLNPNIFHEVITNEVLDRSIDMNHNFINCSICQNLKTNTISKNINSKKSNNSKLVNDNYEMEISPFSVDLNQKIFLFEEKDISIEKDYLIKMMKLVYDKMPLENKLLERLKIIDNKELTINKLIEMLNESYDYYFKGKGINKTENLRYMRKIISIGKENNLKLNRNLFDLHNDLFNALDKNDKGENKYSTIHKEKFLKMGIKKEELSKMSEISSFNYPNSSRDKINNKNNLPTFTKASLFSLKKTINTTDDRFFNQVKFGKNDFGLTTIDNKIQVSGFLSEREAKQFLSLGKSVPRNVNNSGISSFSKNNLGTFNIKTYNNFNVTKTTNDINDDDDYNTSSKLKKYKRKFNVSNLPEGLLVGFHSKEKENSFSKLNSTVEIDQKFEKKIHLYNKLNSSEDLIKDGIIFEGKIEENKINPCKEKTNSTLFPKRSGEICSKAVAMESMKTYNGVVDPFYCINHDYKVIIKNICYALFDLKVDFIQKTLFDFICQIHYEKVKFSLKVYQINSSKDTKYLKFNRFYGNKESFTNIVKSLMKKIRFLIKK